MRLTLLVHPCPPTKGKNVSGTMWIPKKASGPWNLIKQGEQKTERSLEQLRLFSYLSQIYRVINLGVTRT